MAPLAYMRGRTLDDSFIILDEAQNTTGEQMKMFLTRLGFGSKMVITGDITQIDLPDGKKSGLKEAVRILKGIEDIAVFRFTGGRTWCATGWCRTSSGPTSGPAGQSDKISQITERGGYIDGENSCHHFQQAAGCKDPHRPADADPPVLPWPCCSWSISPTRRRSACPLWTTSRFGR